MNICKHLALGIMCCIVVTHAHAEEYYLDSVDGYPSAIPQEWLHTIPCLKIATHTLVPKKIEIVDILKKALEELHNCACKNATHHEKINVWQKVFEQTEPHQWVELYQAAWHVGFNAQHQGEAHHVQAQESVVDGLARAFASRMKHAKKGEIVEVAPFDEIIPGFWKRIGEQSKLLPRG